jgi:hypothetical protein
LFRGCGKMKITKIETFYIKTKIKEHKKIKEKLLFLIDKIPKTSFVNVSHTDWNLPKEQRREYLECFYNILPPYMDKMRKLFDEKTWRIQNTWFQQYYKGGFHEWHRHPKTNFTNVYYLELPSSGMTTKIRPLVNSKKTQSIIAEEGDLITFPACIPHASEKNNDGLRKTVISFNSDFAKRPL